MISYHNDPAIKGWPEWLAKLSDVISDGLDSASRTRFRADLRDAVPVGIDLEPLRHKLAIRRIDRLLALPQSHVGKHGDAIDAVITKTVAALTQVRRCHEAAIGGPVCEVSFDAASSDTKAAAQAVTATTWSVCSAEAQVVRLAVATLESALDSARAAVWATQSGWEEKSADATARESRRSVDAAGEAARAPVWSEESADATAWSARSATWRQEAADLLMELEAYGVS